MGLQRTIVYMGFLASLLANVNCQGASVLTLSDQLVYSGETVIFTCSYAVSTLLISFNIDAYDGSQKMGSFSCNMYYGLTYTSGIFNGTVQVHQCGVSDLPWKFNWTMTATPKLELDFICMTRVLAYPITTFTMTSEKTSLIVDDIRITPTPTVFNESDHALVKCESLRSARTSVLQLTVVSQNGSEVAASGTDSTSLSLPLPLINWHNAIARCLVSNRNSTNITKTSVVSIIHFDCISRHNDSWKKITNGSVNCSAYVSGYPIDSFSWAVSKEVRDNNSFLFNGPIFTMTNDDLESFNCTVTNGMNLKRIVVLFRVNDSRYVTSCFLTAFAAVEHLSTRRLDVTSSVRNNYWILFTSFGGSIVVVGLVIAIAYARRRLNKGIAINMTDNDLYVSLRVQPTGFIPAQLMNSNPVFHRLLIAEKDVIAELSSWILPTTVTMEYSAGYGALNEIIATLIQEIARPSTPKFKSVALYLPTVQKETNLSELTTMRSSDKSTSNEALILSSFESLAKICLDQKHGSWGIDIFNYCGQDASSLAAALTDGLKVPVTVSYGYGFDKSTDLKRLHSSMAAKYLNFLRFAAT